ncbi:NADH:ubiquinone reductase (Na(+)-transporting) subunit C [Flavobacterium cyclinae]|uniref:NADH:ubiquinone reductase (Na(+)-transporting) subunit C n=1 Tax=Flavobacterium cyclinae TaxID=2895947 RepID=UPI001E42F05B|nr:NADH:ubiquinone reductase (Na(+)-transporting) subunit C [Flavobacterium cyclinae]UGS21501.1 NADH:ubiquinone reductase (Na(+)-transporting) subunit C [Flavobacterium cyclinae]
MNRESNGYTFLFATVMVVLVASALAFAATALKPDQQANIKKEKMQYILKSFGVAVERDASEEAYKKHIISEIVFDENGNEISKDAFIVDIAKEKGKFPIFNAEKDGKKFYVIPVRGMGLWDAIWGYVSIDENLKVDGIVFDHKGETPGLGGEITQDYFQNSFKGESVFDANGNLQGLKVVKGYTGKDNKDDGEVDAISGATLTGNGVTEMLVRGLKPYEKYLKSNKK